MAEVDHQEAQEAQESPARLRVALVTVSDTRTAATDTGGDLAAALVGAAGFEVTVRELIPDDEEQIRACVRGQIDRGGVDAVLVTGGTGVAPRDRTVEALLPLIERRLDGYGELLRMLSFAEIGPAALLSRAVGGVTGQVAIFAMPGSPAGVRLAIERLIVPELPHVIAELRRGAGEGHARHRGHARHGGHAQRPEHGPPPADGGPHGHDGGGRRAG